MQAFDGRMARRHCSDMKQTDFQAARLTVRLGAVVSNFRVCQRLAGPAAVAAVVKADAYGLGAKHISEALSRAGCDTFFVARAEEGVALRPIVPHARIFVLDGAVADCVPALISHRLTPVLNSLSQMAGWRAAAKETRTILDAAIHIDTGMNRLGLPGEELSLLAAGWTKRVEGLRPVLVMSHLACADDPESKMNGVQLERFRTALAMLPPMPASFASSGGVLLGKTYAFDLVRPGIGLYGGNIQNMPVNPFSVAAVLTARILQVRRVDSGGSVGYGATFLTKRPSVLATVALGYADGLMRAIGNRGHAAVGRALAPVLGRVSMDLTTLDVTDIPSKYLGPDAEAEFVGDTISLEEAARAGNTASYEILASLTSRVPRHYVDSAA
jgi:alanine racemase